MSELPASCAFYDPTGETPLDTEAFIAFYSKCYYLGNSRVAEADIEKLLQADALSPEEVMRIIRWKLNRIDHKRSQRSGIVCSRDTEPFITVSWRRRIDVEALCCYVSRELNNLRRLEDPQTILNQLKEKGGTPEYFGTVYLVTLLYFITKGKYPIYDRFAMRALAAFSEGKKPGEAVPDQELPAKNDPGYALLLTEHKNPSVYQRYIHLLQIVFGDRYQTDRDIDRALWVYGHLFAEKDDRA